MQIRNLGGSGLRVSAVGLGCNNFGQRTDLETSRKVIHKAIDLGITLFDTADIYAGMGGSETVLGTVLGIAAAGAVWDVVAGWLIVVPRATVPWSVCIVALAVMMLSAVSLAAIAGRRHAGSPAPQLRVE